MYSAAIHPEAFGLAPPLEHQPNPMNSRGDVPLDKHHPESSDSDDSRLPPGIPVRHSTDSGVTRLAVWSLLVINCWWWMQILHESGHVLVSLAVGAKLLRVSLPPWSISQTDVEPHPLTLWIVWGGLVGGVTWPLLLVAIARVRRWSLWPEIRFFAGFCLIANGGYLFAGCLTRIGDAEVLLQQGAPHWLLLVAGFGSTGLGLALWHRLGPQMGLGPEGLTDAPRRLVTQVLISLTALAVQLGSWAAF